MGVFINLSNHSSNKWSASQLSAAHCFGEIVDVSFPTVPASAGSNEIDLLVQKYLEKLSGFDIAAVMLQGEFVFTYRLVNALKERGIKVLSACSERVSSEHTDSDGKTQRESTFEFVQFREY